MLTSPSPISNQDQNEMFSSNNIGSQQEIRLSGDDIKAEIIASLTLDQKLQLLQKRQRLLERIR